MLRLLLPLVLAAASTNAVAADLSTLPGQPQYDWSGLSVGVYGGGGWSNVDASQMRTDAFGGAPLNQVSGPFSFDTSGANGGIQVGYDHQMESLVFGVAGELGFLDFNESVVDPTTLPAPVPNAQPVTSFRSDWQGSVLGRVGVSFDRTLIYAKAGVSVLHGTGRTVDSCRRAFCGIITIDAEDSDLLLGWTAGAGVEVGLSENWSVGAEYRYFDYSDVKVDGVASNDLVYHQNIGLDGVQTARAFISYRF